MKIYHLDAIKVYCGNDFIPDKAIITQALESSETTSPHLLKTSLNTNISLITMPDGSRAYIKRYNVKKWWHRFRNLICAPKGISSFINAMRLDDMGIPTPKALFSFNHLGYSYIATEEIKNALCLGEAYGMLKNSGSSTKKLLDKSADLVSDLHKKGIYHDDLNEGNILVSMDNLYLIDLDRLHFKKPSEANFIRNLTKISAPMSNNLSFFDAMRFYSIYSKKMNFGKAYKKELLKKLLKIHQKRVNYLKTMRFQFYPRGI